MIWWIIMIIFVLLGVGISIIKTEGFYVLAGLTAAIIMLFIGIATSLAILEFSDDYSKTKTSNIPLYQLELKESTPDEAIYFDIKFEKGHSIGWYQKEDDSNPTGKVLASIKIDSNVTINNIEKKEKPYLIQEKYEDTNTAKSLFCMFNNDPYYKYNFYIPENNIKYDFTVTEE